MNEPEVATGHGDHRVVDVECASRLRGLLEQLGRVSESTLIPGDEAQLVVAAWELVRETVPQLEIEGLLA